MDKADTKDGDIVITLGRAFVGYDTDNDLSTYPIDINYNVSHFLRLHEPATDKSNHEEEVHLNKFHIDISDPRYSHVYKNIDIIVKRVIVELAKLDSFFEHVNLRRTGSSMSGVKVGFPHESDYVMELPRNKQLMKGKTFFVYTLFLLVQEIVAKQAAVLTKGLRHWVIHGVQRHMRTGGVCLVMQCLSRENDSTSDEVGVTVDLVPVYIMDATKESLNEKAAAFLPHSLNEYAQKGELYMLVHERFCDTGFIENNIIKQLPDNTKRAYRFAKYLIPNLMESSVFPFDNIKTMDKATKLRLYGIDSELSSYKLRVFFLHLLFHVHGTEAEHRLKGGLLFLCLLDIVEHFTYRSGYVDCDFNHPLIKNRVDYHFISHFPKTPAWNFMQRLARTSHEDLADEFASINRKMNYILRRKNLTSMLANQSHSF